MMFDALTRKLLRVALASGLAVVSAAASAAPAFVAPTFLLPYAKNARLFDYRPAINAAGTRVVFERQSPTNGVYGPTFLYIVDLANPPPQPLLVSGINSARADWCWYKDQPWADGPIAYSDGAGIHTVAPVAGSTPTLLPNTQSFIYPYWFSQCRTLAVDATVALPRKGVPDAGGAPETFDIDAATGASIKSLSGQSLWAGFPSVNRQLPGLLAFAGQQFTPTGYDQDKNYVYLSDFSFTPPIVRPLDPRASTKSFDPRYQGRAPVWSPDGLFIAFESNRACGGGAVLAVFIQDGLGLKPAIQVTDCKYDVQHPKWYRHPVNGRVQIIASALLHVDPAPGSDPLIKQARGIASFDVTPFVTH